MISRAALLLLAAGAASAQGTYNFTINTLAVKGQPGKIVLDYTVNVPGGSGNSVYITNYTSTGTGLQLGLPETQGGLVTGDIILLNNPASSTQIIGGAFFNELAVTYVKFGDQITFSVDVPASSLPGIPDEFSLYILDANNRPLFSTSDPTGGNALVVMDANGQPGGAVTIYNPAVLTSPNNILITVNGGGVPIRVRSGSPLYTDPGGRNWSADYGFLSPSGTFGLGVPVANTTTPYLYQNERFSTSSLQYQFPVPNGSYNVRLKFAEIYFTQAGQRSFDILINGTVVRPAFDIVAAAGADNTAVDLVFPANVTTGQINIQLNPVVSSPKISSIEILAAGADITLAPSVAFLGPGQQTTFTPTLIGGGSATYTLSPNLGSINTGGVYTAPASIPSAQLVTITATSSIDSSKTATATVYLTAGWTSQDVGFPNAAGSYSFANGSHTVQGSGDVFGTQDAFRYVYQQMSGDGSIIARVNAAGPCCVGFGKAGVMMRQSLASNSAHAFSSLLAAIVGLLETRATQGGNTTYLFGSGGLTWVRLTRTGNTFTGYVSNDGIIWVQVGTPTVIVMSDPIYVGLAVSSAFAPLSTVIFDNVRISTSTAVSVDQSFAYLAAGQSVNLTATVTGSSNNAVTWSLSPVGVGAITPLGVYTAPASIPAPQTVTATATSVLDPTKSASTLIQLSSFVPIRINAGGPSTIDPAGVFWNGETGASAGSTFSAGTPVTGTATPYIYQSEHFNTGPFSYTFPVPNGLYTVNLKFAEIYFTSPGLRPFNVTLNGLPVLVNFDVYTAAGGAFKAYDQSFPVSVVNGQIVINFIPINNSVPKINAIEITSPGLTQGPPTRHQ